MYKYLRKCAISQGPYYILQLTGTRLNKLETT